MEIIAFLITGFLLGAKHSLDSDHLVAMSTIISENPRRKISVLKGAVWGLGHTATLFIVGFFELIFKLSLPRNIANILETVVGFVLIYLGIALFIKIRKTKAHFHIHEHKGEKHFHLHTHTETNEHDHMHKPFWVGVIHGLAGSAAIMLIVLSGANSTIVGLTFILLFGVGLIVGMTIFGLLASISMEVANTKIASLNHKLKLLIASASTAIGLSIIFHTI